MATEKKYLSYDMLSLYDSKMKEHVAGGDAATLAEAKTYAEELGDNYDASGSAATAESNANKYTDEQLATEKARAEAAEANLQEQINSVSNSANLEEIVNSINGFNEYMAEHGEVAEGFRTAIDANTQAIEALEETLADGVAVSWNDLEDRPFGDTITPVVSGSAVIPAGSTSLVTVVRGVGYVENKRRYIHDNAIIYGVIDGVKYYVEDVQSIANSTICLCTIDDCAINLSAGADRKPGAYLIQASVDGNLGRDLTIELFYNLLETKTIDAKFLPEEAQSDWNQNDEKAPSYVKNRPMYYSRVKQKDATIFEVSYTADDLDYENESIDFGLTDIFTPVDAEQDWTYRAVVDGVAYEDLKPYRQSGFGASLVGSTDFSEYPFYLHFGGGSFMCGFATKEDHTVKFTADIPEIVSPMDEKWLPESVAKTTLRSTTEESTKKFDVTVDDEGNLSTTDVETGETKVIGSGSGSGATSWNDLEDKPFGDGPITEDMVFSISFDGAEGNVIGDGVAIYLIEDLPIEADKEYIVVFDGARYELTSFADSFGYINLGDSSGSLTEDIPFVCFKSISETGIKFYGLTTHHVEILTQNRSYNTIDINYLPAEALSPCYEIPEQAGSLLYEFELSAEDLNPYEDGGIVHAYTGSIDSVELYAGQWYQVELDGELYSVECIDDYYDYIGDTSFATRPFYLYANGSIGFATSGPHNMKIYELKAAEVVPLDIKFLPKTIRADWNENDINSFNHIANRPFYDATTLSVIYTGELNFGNNSNMSVTSDSHFALTIGNRYSVKLDGARYNVIAIADPYNSGNVRIGYNPDDHNDETPFVISCYNYDENTSFYMEASRGKHSVEISEITDEEVVKMDSKYLPDDAIADWNTGDKNSPSYVRNRTHWKDFNYTALTDEISVELKGQSYSAVGNIYYYENSGCFYQDGQKMFSLELGKTYRITDNGKIHYLVARHDHHGAIYVGNYNYVAHGTGDPNNTPHDTDVNVAIWNNGDSLRLRGGIGEHTIKVELEGYEYHPLDLKYLPMDDITAAVLSALPTWTGGSY